MKILLLAAIICSALQARAEDLSVASIEVRKIPRVGSADPAGQNTLIVKLNSKACANCEFVRVQKTNLDLVRKEFYRESDTQSTQVHWHIDGAEPKFVLSDRTQTLECLHDLELCDAEAMMNRESGHCEKMDPKIMIEWNFDKGEVRINFHTELINAKPWTLPLSSCEMPFHKKVSPVSV